jgi:membrane-bound lytic murein transglycosylase F
MEQIWKRGKIVMITDTNVHNYYWYARQPMGFEFDLAQAFADYLGVELQVIAPGWDRMVDTLATGKGDFIAAGLTRSSYWRERVDFSDAYMKTKLEVIVHMSNHNIQTISDLNGKQVHVRSGTDAYRRLLELNAEGYDIRIAAHHTEGCDDLIRQVAERDIDITIADSHVTFINQRYHPEIRKPFSVSDHVHMGWAVNKGDQQLAEMINRFFERIINNGNMLKIRNRYYAHFPHVDYYDLLKFHQRLKTRLPTYQSVIMREAQRHYFDWRLIAALIYQESHFNPEAISYTGVRGLMQLTLETANDLGVENRGDPIESIGGGVKYLKWLYGLFDDISGFDRILFAMASYNIGYGHVRDAQNIARSKGYAHQKWIALRETLPLLRQSTYYRKTMYGYARGNEPVRYVDNIMLYYDILRWKSSTLADDSQ